MEIGPIVGIPPVARIKPDRLPPDLSRVFEAEYLGGNADDSVDEPTEDPEGDDRSDQDVIESPEQMPSALEASHAARDSDEPAPSIDCFA